MSDFRLPPPATVKAPQTGVELDLHNYRRTLHSMLFLVGTSDEVSRKPTQEMLDAHMEQLEVDKVENGHYNDRSLDDIARAHFPSNPGKLLGLLQAAEVIADVGSGVSTLGSETLAMFPQKQFLAIDSDPAVLEQDLPDECKVVADACDMPEVADETSDLTIATFSVPYWAPTPEQAQKSVNEMFRITRAGGTILVNAMFGDVVAKTGTILNAAFQQQPLSMYDAVVMHHDMLVLDTLIGLQDAGKARVRHSPQIGDRINTSIKKIST